MKRALRGLHIIENKKIVKKISEESDVEIDWEYEWVVFSDFNGISVTIDADLSLEQMQLILKIMENLKPYIYEGP